MAGVARVAGGASWMQTILDFEKPIAELEIKIGELRSMSGDDGVNIGEEVTKLQAKVKGMLEDTYSSLLPWQKVQVARHPNRPHFKDYVEELIEDFTPLAGDRSFGEDTAIIGGLGRFRSRTVMVIGHEKGADTDSRIKHNFGMARPEGYRKAVRLMELADRFGIPVVTLVDTTGAYPGIGGEERGVAVAIARSMDCCLRLGVPMVSAVIGEGGSGGAIALATANHVIMLEHAVYSIISPEACSSILWRDQDHAKDAAAALRMTAQDLMEFGVVDEVVAEPLGGAQRDPRATIGSTGDAIDAALRRLLDLGADELRAKRRQKFLDMGRVGLN